MSVNSKMTALANEVRTLSGTTTTKSIDAMTSDVNAANTEVNSQTALINQIQSALAGKAAGGLIPTGTREEWFSGDAEFDVTTASTFIAHTPQIFYRDITDLSQVTDQNTLYTMPDGLTYILAVDENDNYVPVRGKFQCDMNGFDAVVPLIDPNDGGSSGSAILPTCKIKFTESALVGFGDFSLHMSSWGEIYYGGSGGNTYSVDMSDKFAHILCYDSSSGTFNPVSFGSLMADTEYEVLLGTIIDKGSYGSFSTSGGTVTEVCYDTYGTGSSYLYIIEPVASNIGATITFEY